MNPNWGNRCIRQILTQTIVPKPIASESRGRILGISVSFCIFVCLSASEAGVDFQVFVSFQGSLTHFRYRFSRELCLLCH